MNSCKFPEFDLLVFAREKLMKGLPGRKDVLCLVPSSLFLEKIFFTQKTRYDPTHGSDL